MQHLTNGAASLNLLFNLNLDRLIYFGAIALALAAGGYLGSY